MNDTERQAFQGAADQLVSEMKTLESTMVQLWDATPTGPLQQAVGVQLDQISLAKEAIAALAEMRDGEALVTAATDVSFNDVVKLTGSS